MAITDMLNRRVRARPDDEDDDVYSEQSDIGEEPSQDEAEEHDSDVENLQSDDVHYLLQSSSRLCISPLTRLFHRSHKRKDQKMMYQTQPQPQTATPIPLKPSQTQTRTPPTKTISKPP